MDTLDYLLEIGLTLLLTLIIEMSAAFLLKVRDKYDFVNIFFINGVTNPLVNLAYVMIVTLFSLEQGAIYRYIVVLILEIIVWFVEYRFYFKTLKNLKIHPALFSFILNAASFIIGLFIL
ncbi:MAG: hypothetical protein J5372_06940 [Lachnospiraceae bacterium]|nr:hypothetical protein [Lachnospiraceae bacterium]